MTLIYRKQWLMMGWCMIALVWYLSLIPAPPDVGIKLWDKLNHFIAYAGLVGWFGQLFRQQWHRVILAVSFISMGIAIEIAQDMGTHRLFEYKDILANTVGVVIALVMLYLKGDGILFWLEQRFVKRHE